MTPPNRDRHGAPAKRDDGSAGGDPGFTERMNRAYFDGRLSPDVLDRLSNLPTEREDVKAFVERMFRFMTDAEMTAHDLSTLQGEVLGSLLARILPGAWQGRVPPITVKGRHRRIDDYVRNNRYLGRRDAGRMLDLGCGFPPETTIDTAEHLDAWTIHGADPSMPAFVVQDPQGAYASFDDNDRMIYCQPSAPSVETWNELLADHDATARRFLAIRDAFGDARIGTHDADDGSRLTIDPARSYERPNLTLGVGGIGDVEIADLDVVRCFNVLYYFDDDYRRKALDWFGSVLADDGILIVGGDWAFTTECRYFLYQKLDGALRPREFAFSIDNVVPLGVVPFFALHDEDRGLRMLARLVRTLRRDPAFRRRYYEFVDALRVDANICPRDDDGYYASVDPDVPPDELWKRAAKISAAIAAEFGTDAVGVLERAGWDARVNEIGDVAVALESDPP